MSLKTGKKLIIILDIMILVFIAFTLLMGDTPNLRPLIIPALGNIWFFASYSKRDFKSQKK